MDAVDQTITQLPVTNGTTSMTNGNSNSAAQGSGSDIRTTPVPTSFDDPMQSQGISAGMLSPFEELRDLVN